MPTRPFSLIRSSNFLGLFDDLPTQAGDEQASILRNLVKQRKSLKRRLGQAVLGTAPLSPDQNLDHLEWYSLNGTEHLLGVHDRDLADFLTTPVGSIVGNGANRFAAGLPVNSAWVESMVVLGDGVSPNTRYNGEETLAAQFTAASSQSLSNITATAMNLADHDLHVSFWVYFDSFATGFDKDLVTMWNWTDNAKKAFAVYFGGSPERFRFTARNPGGTTVEVEYTGSVVVGTWYFVQAWHDATANTLNLKINDTTTVSAAFSTGFQVLGPADVPLRVGAITGAANIAEFFHSGRIDSLAIHKSAPAGGAILTNAIRTSLYASGRGKVYSQSTTVERANLVDWWDLDERTGNRVGESAGLVLTASASSPTASDGIVAVQPAARQMVTPATTPPTVDLDVGSTHDKDTETEDSDFLYRISFLNADGEYGEASEVGSDTAYTFNLDFTANLTVIPQPAAGEDASGIRIWRKSGGSPFYRFVADIPVGTTSYLDEVLNANLGEELVEFNTAFPPARYFTEWGGRLVGAMDDVLYISNFQEPWWAPLSPDLDNPNQGATIHMQGRAGGVITGARTHGGVVAVFTGGNGHLLTGDQPLNFKLQVFTSHGCVAHRTIVSARDLLIWLSNDGVYTWDGRTTQRISEDVTTTVEGISAADMANAHAVLFADRYYLMWPSGCLVYDLQYRIWSQYDNWLMRDSTTSEYVDGTKQRMWGAHEGHARVYQLEIGTSDAIPTASTAIVARWASKDWDAGSPAREKRVSLMELKFRKCSAPATATVTLKRGTGETIQTEVLTISAVEHPDDSVSSHLVSVNEMARSEQFRLDVTISTLAPECEILACGLMYKLAS